MPLKILMSTMNKKSIEDLELSKKNISNEDSIIIINQITNKKIEKSTNKNFVTYNELGLSKSRNRALEHVTKGIGIIADDDICYKKNYREIVKKAYEENKNADIITFQIETPEGGLFKNYSKESFYFNSLNILKVSSIEITFDIERVKSRGIKFDEMFGLGGKYKTGEEAIFLKDCLDKGLKILYLPKVLVIHPKDSSGDLLNESGMFYKGAVFRKMYGRYGIIICFLFSFKKNKLNLLKYILNGYFNYFKEGKK